MGFFGADNGLKNLNDVAKETVKQEADKFFKVNQELEDKVMELHAISYLMGNRDLHVNNIMVITDKEGKKSVAPIDFGLSGHDMKVLDSWYYKSRFDTTNLHHSDGNLLFSEDKYKPAFSKNLGEFELKKDAILDKVFYQCRAAGASDAEY